MAQNVAQILEQNGPQSKIVLWAHNAHIANAEGRLGSYLKQQFDEQVYLLGFEFNQGEFTSRMATVHTYGVKPAPPTYYALRTGRRPTIRSSSWTSELWRASLSSVLGWQPTRARTNCRSYMPSIVFFQHGTPCGRAGWDCTTG